MFHLYSRQTLTATKGDLSYQLYTHAFEDDTSAIRSVFSFLPEVVEFLFWIRAILRNCNFRFHVTLCK